MRPFEFYIRFPRKELAHIIHHFEWFEIPPATSLKNVIGLPSFAIAITLFFYRRERMIVSSGLFSEFLTPEIGFVPPVTSYFTQRNISDCTVFRIILQPGMFQHIFGLSLAPFRNQNIDPAYAIEASIHSMYENTLKDHSLTNCIAVAEAYFLRKRISVPNRILFKSTNSLLSKTSVPLKASQLADDLGVSHQHLNRLMRQQFGFSAKQFLKVHRFWKCLVSINSHSPLSLAQIALEAGYYDQAHFNHEFKEMTGISPGLYIKQLKGEMYETFEDQEHHDLFGTVLKKA